MQPDEVTQTKTVVNKVRHHDTFLMTGHHDNTQQQDAEAWQHMTS